MKINLNMETESTTNPQIQLPEPDSDNITVLTDKLPNKPILPWNHYDSPWHESENKENLEESVIENEAPEST
jgi:hypothetical protein